MLQTSSAIQTPVTSHAPRHCVSRATGSAPTPHDTCASEDIVPPRGCQLTSRPAPPRHAWHWPSRPSSGFASATTASPPSREADGLDALVACAPPLFVPNSTVFASRYGHRFLGFQNKTDPTHPSLEVRRQMREMDSFSAMNLFRDFYLVQVSSSQLLSSIFEALN